MAYLLLRCSCAYTSFKRDSSFLQLKQTGEHSSSGPSEIASFMVSEVSPDMLNGIRGVKVVEFIESGTISSLQACRRSLLSFAEANDCDFSFDAIGKIRTN